ncbi:hypothetical protein FACS1894160_4060 [Bacteroidia bacterium]|nr:hypothetical protein FACS1894123_00750 [Bacteroidia bacterium]GHV08940.1 hypothetical protein FACS1894160_4060 [Bacteroidia bacterium]
MKKFFTILLVFIGLVNLSAQNIPSSIWGDVYIAGPMYSGGHIYVNADDPAQSATGTQRGAIDIVTTGTLYVDSITFCSNRERNGLLRNKGAVEGKAGGSGTSPNYVAVRKYLTTTVGWEHVSFPFDVLFANIKSADGTSLVESTDFWVYFYNIKARALSGTTTGNWSPIAYADSIGLPTDILKKGIGYNIWGESSGVEWDFATTDATQIAELFAVANKTTDLAYYEGPRSIGGGAGFTTRYGSGWNLIGGLNSDNFVVHNDTGLQQSLTMSSVADTTSSYPQTSLTYGTVYYWDTPGDNNSFQAYSLDPTLVPIQAPLIMSPYVPFFVQTDTIPTVNPRRGGSIIFNGNGNFITYSNSTRPSPPKYTRSFTDENSENRDVFSLSLTTSGNENSKDQTFLMFGDMYHEDYIPVEDGIKMTRTVASAPCVWSEDEDGGAALFMNRLPRKEQMREIKIGFSAPFTAEYTFDIIDVQNTTVRSAVLRDKWTNEQVDLLLSPYTFSAAGSASEVKDRFVLFVNGSVTDLDKIASDQVYAYTSDNILTVKNLSPGNNIQVTDLSGRTIVKEIVKSEKFSTALNQKGVYIISVKGEKNAVLKVLNK